MTVADVFVGVAAVLIAGWIIFFAGCAPPPLPPEPPYTETVAMNRDR